MHQDVDGTNDSCQNEGCGKPRGALRLPHWQARNRDQARYHVGTSIHAGCVRSIQPTLTNYHGTPTPEYWLPDYRTTSTCRQFKCTSLTRRMLYNMPDSNNTCSSPIFGEARNAVRESTSRSWPKRTAAPWLNKSALCSQRRYKRRCQRMMNQM